MGWRHFILALLGVYACLEGHTSARAEVLALSGSDWFIHQVESPLDTAPALADINPKDWIPSRVPGNIQADLESARLIGPLWYGAGDPRLADVAKKNWWYRKDFVAPKTFRGQRLQLIFGGVDFAYEVWLNGKSLGTKSGQFRRSEFDVSELVKPGEVNRLAVRIEPIPPQLERCWATDLPMSGVGTPDWFVNCYALARQTLRDLKSASNLAYDWGVNIYTLGIWRDVWLDATGPARIDSLSTRTTLSEGNTRARVRIRLEVDSSAALTTRASFRVTGPGFRKTVITDVRLSRHGNEVEAVLPIEKPALWWPNGQGSQPLYDLEATLTAASGTVLDRKHTRFGVREVRWTQVEGAPADFPNPYQLVINGRQIRMLGSSLIPPDLLFGRNGVRAPGLLRRAQAAGLNTLRLWGGGVTLPPGFYDLADELGIMLSQEFPLANSSPETDAIFLSNLSHSITDIVKELRNHPSIIEWVGGNEMPWTQSSDHLALRVLEKVCAANDDRIFRATDPIDGSRHSPWFFIPQVSYEHYNHIWELPKDPNSPFTMSVMRYGEFGSQTPANLEVFQREIPPASQWPLEDIDDPVLIRKNILQAAFNPLDWLYKPVIEGYFGPQDGPEDLIKAGQYIGAESLRYFVDELRRKGKKIGGILSWDFNEPWPNGAGSYLVDYDGQPLMNYYFMQQALAPVSLTLRYESNLYQPPGPLKADLWLASDAPAASGAVRWNWTARDRRGRVLARDTGTASINPGEAKKLGSLEIKPPPETALGPILIELQARDSRGQLLSERVHVFGGENSAAWPFDGLLRNTVPDHDDTDIKPRKPIRVLWIQDGTGGAYDDTAWPLRRFAVDVTYVHAAAEDLEKAAPTAEALLRNYDAIWMGAGDFTKLTPIGERLGAKNLSNIAAAVEAGLGIGFEGGWNSFAAAGFAGTALETLLPVEETSPDHIDRHTSGKVSVADPHHPLVAGRFTSTFPALGGYLVLKAKASAHIVLQSGSGEPLLMTSHYGKGRVLGFSSSVSTQWWRFDGKGIDWAWNLRAWSGQPVFVARMLSWLGNAGDDALSSIDLPESGARTTLPVRRTTVRVTGAPQFHASRSGERLSVELENTGSMTALFCSPHSILEYRTDTTVSGAFLSIPPGERRSMTIEASPQADHLGLSDVGWRISCWNAAPVEISPSRDVLLSFGRRDSMTREFAGPAAAISRLAFAGPRPDSEHVPWILPRPSTAKAAGAPPDALEFNFEVSAQQAARPTRLNINTADQSADQASVIEIEANGHRYSYSLQRGLGRQIADPAHLAFPETARIDLPGATWRVGTNVLTVRVRKGGWFTWDSLDLSSISPSGPIPSHAAVTP